MACVKTQLLPEHKASWPQRRSLQKHTHINRMFSKIIPNAFTCTLMHILEWSDDVALDGLVKVIDSFVRLEMLLDNPQLRPSVMSDLAWDA